MVFGNLSDAIKASLVPILVAVAAVLIAVLVFDMPLSMMSGAGGPGQMMMEPPASAYLGLLLLLVVYLFVFGWIAVTWHRYVLLEEYPASVPAIGGRPIWPYIGKSILIGLIVVVIAIPLFFIVGLLGAGVMMGGGGMGGAMVVGTIIGLGIGAVLTWLWFRFAIVLPGTAIGKPMKAGEGWNATKALSGTIFQASLIIVGINIVASLVVGVVSAGVPILGAILNLGVTWVTLMVGASLLTTLYGHIVEGRPLID
ncbi:hypothetical protein EU803_09635 [Loktanella sp. IMCC34160]|uniref:hypothetical protein n=1 Tax=Loktanella sp. IMCC34160 TaxID=2510646 RepID=UPI00101D1BF7|nr:hypothetical protein [Loktanella sp. IMCC34160]RYG91344.1 hypothetical protein EU803_09635 [Loktanella sp. IMCC34160]